MQSLSHNPAARGGNRVRQAHEILHRQRLGTGARIDARPADHLGVAEIPQRVAQGLAPGRESPCHQPLERLSVLGPLEPIDARSDAFTVGVHGLVAEQGFHRGLLLPQVATEWGWDGEQFLRQTCIKAGLAPDAWHRGARFFRFAAEVFGD